MKGIKLKILLVVLMLVPVPFSCKDKNECLDLYVEPYFSIMELDFKNVDLYYEYYIKDKKHLMFDTVSQDFASQVYPCDSIALYIEAPANGGYLFHSQHIIPPRFGFMQEAFACNSKRPGWAGTRELIDKIYVSSDADFDETHGKDYDLSDIIDIFTYNTGWMPLNEFNQNSPFEAPARFHLLIKRKPTRSMTHQFMVRYYMKTEPGAPPKHFIINIPRFQVR